MSLVKPTAHQALNNFVMFPQNIVHLKIVHVNGYDCRSAYLTVLKICKLLLSTLGHIMYRCMEESPIAEVDQNRDSVVQRCPVTVLKHALSSVPNTSTEYMLRNVACQLAERYADKVHVSPISKQRSAMHSNIAFDSVFKILRRVIRLFTLINTVETLVN